LLQGRQLELSPQKVASLHFTVLPGCRKVRDTVGLIRLAAHTVQHKLFCFTLREDFECLLKTQSSPSLALLDACARPRAAKDGVQGVSIRGILASRSTESGRKVDSIPKYRILTAQRRSADNTAAGFPCCDPNPKIYVFMVPNTLPYLDCNSESTQGVVIKRCPWGSKGVNQHKAFIVHGQLSDETAVLVYYAQAALNSSVEVKKESVVGELCFS